MARNKIQNEETLNSTDIIEFPDIQVEDSLDEEFTQEPVGEAEVKAIYVKKSINGFYIGFPEEIDAEYWEGQIGETYEDFLNDKWVLLNDEQVQFHLDNPNASVREVLNMLNDSLSEEDIIQNTKYQKLTELKIYDNSSEVNEFSINGTLKAWFTPDERSNYKNSIDSAKLLGIKNLQLLIDGNLIQLSTDKAALLLATILLYADACYMVTKQHETAINQLSNVIDIKEYDFTLGYPEKLNFEL